MNIKKSINITSRVNTAPAIELLLHTVIVIVRYVHKYEMKKEIKLVIFNERTSYIHTCMKRCSVLLNMIICNIYTKHTQ